MTTDDTVAMKVEESTDQEVKLPDNRFALELEFGKP